MGRIRSLLLGSVVRKVASAVVVLVLVVGAGLALGVLGAPAVTGVQNSFGDVNDSATAIETDLGVSNPNPVGVSLGDLTVDYAVRMNDVPMANGTKRGLSVGTGESTVHLTTHMRNGRIPAWWVSHLRNGERTTVRIDATAHSGLLGQSFGAPSVTREVNTDVISQFNSTETRPVNAGVALVEDPVLYVNETSARWGNVTAERTPIRMEFVVYNPKSVPVPITELGYDVTMNDVTVGEGASERTVTVPPRATRTVETTTYIQNDRLDEWWVSHLRRNQRTDLRIDFYAKLDLGAAGTVRVPLRDLTYEKTVETDIFGTKNATAPAGDGPGNASAGTTTSTTTASDETATATTTAGSDETTTAETTTSGETTAFEGTTASDGTTNTTTTEDGGILGARDGRPAADTVGATSGSTSAAGRA